MAEPCPRVADPVHSITTMTRAVRSLTVASTELSEFQQTRGVAPVDLLSLCLSDGQAIDHLDRLANVLTSTLGIERGIRCEEDIVHTEETQAADRRIVGAERRRIRIEHLEVVQWPFLQLLQQLGVVAVGRARTQ